MLHNNYLECFWMLSDPGCGSIALVQWAAGAKASCYWRQECGKQQNKGRHDCFTTSITASSAAQLPLMVALLFTVKRNPSAPYNQTIYIKGRSNKTRVPFATLQEHKVYNSGRYVSTISKVRSLIGSSGGYEAQRGGVIQIAVEFSRSAAGGQQMTSEPGDVRPGHR